MKKIFIGGSRSICRLNSQIKERLDKIIAQSFTILIGDANGVDKAVRIYCKEHNYINLIIYCSGNVPRNNEGEWQTQSLNLQRGSNGLKFYTIKDIEMAKDADYGFMIWDGKSAGTISNVINLLELGKVVLVFMYPSQKFIKLCNLNDLSDLISHCSEQSIRLINRKLKLEHRLESIRSSQVDIVSQQI